MDRTSHIETPPEQPQEAQSPVNRAHVLVVDDKDAIRTFLGEVLDLANHRVSTAIDGEEALSLCANDPPHVVLTDLVMEPMSGRELVQQLAAAHPTVVPIVVTGHGSVERTVELMRVGAFDVLTKPCTAAEVLATVEKALAHRESLLAEDTGVEELRAAAGRDRLVQEKLAMIGKLAAGVAHELNNPLDAVLRCVRLSKDRVQDDLETTEYLDLAHAGLLRMADIVQSLLTFSREAAFEQAPQRLDALVIEALTSVALALGSRAPHLTEDLKPAVAGHPVPRGLHQVLTNLLRNAADACEGEGTIRVHARAEGDRLLIDVADEGPGIPEDVLPRVFEPFFTTKDPGKGTGLGLPISARLVEKFGGSMSIECPTSGGTVVTISLPIRDSESGARQEAS